MTSKCENCESLLADNVRLSGEKETLAAITDKERAHSFSVRAENDQLRARIGEKDERIAALEKDAARPTIEKMHAQWFKFGPTNEPVTVTFGTDDIERMKAAPEGTVWRLCNNDALNPHANGMSGTATGRDG